MGERAIVVEHRKELTYLLCQAAELEHTLMAQYLFAAFTSRGAAAATGADKVLDAVAGNPRGASRRLAEHIEPV